MGFGDKITLKLAKIALILKNKFRKANFGGGLNLKPK